MTYDIYTYALKVLKDREEYYGKQASQAKSYSLVCDALARAASYNSAWWILKYATEENWDALEQFDYYYKEEEE